MTNLSISISSTNRFFIKLLTTRKICLIISTSLIVMYLINYGIGPTSDLHVAGYFFCKYL